MKTLSVKTTVGNGIHMKLGNTIEVNMMALPQTAEGAGQYASYPACLVYYNMDTKTAQIYLAHDAQMIRHTVPLDCIARASMPLPGQVFSSGSPVEVQARVSETDEYGWWAAKVVTHDAKAMEYLVEWPRGAGQARVSAVHVRAPSFRYFTNQ